MDMDKDVEKIGMRSEKVRRIMSEEPPWWINYGIYIVVVVLVLMVIIACRMIKC
jgi:hypothetical protein